MTVVQLAEVPNMPPKNTPPTDDICLGCGGADIFSDHDAGEKVCRGCGLVVSDEIQSRGPEWRAFTQEEKDRRSRVGSGETPSHRVRGSTFSEKERGLTPDQKRDWGRRKRHHKRATLHGSKEKNLATAMNELNRLASLLHIPPHCRDEAAATYRRALDARLVRGRSIDGMMAASVNVGIRLHKVPRRLKEVTDASPRSRSEIARCYRMLLEKFNIKMPAQDARDYIPRIAYKVGINRITQDRAYDILLEAKRRRISMGKDSAGLAAAALYIASDIDGENKTQKELANAAGVTEVTIRNRYKELEKKLLDVGALTDQIVLDQIEVYTP